MSPLGLLGAIGDQQDKGEKGAFLGINKSIEEDAVKIGCLEIKIDMIFYGHETRPIPKAIAYTTEPFIPGLSGSEENCVAFLKMIGIKSKASGKWRTLRDLNKNDKQTLFSTLSKHMVSQGSSAEIIHKLIGTIYTLTKEEPHTPFRDCREYSTLLNACGRIGHPSIGISVVLGDRNEAMKEAEL